MSRILLFSAALLGLTLSLASAQTLPLTPVTVTPTVVTPVTVTLAPSLQTVQPLSVDVYVDGLQVLSNLAENTGGRFVLAQPGTHYVTLVRHGQLPGTATVSQATYTSTAADQAVQLTIGTGGIINFH